MRRSSSRGLTSYAQGLLGVAAGGKRGSVTSSIPEDEEASPSSPSAAAGDPGGGGGDPSTRRPPTSTAAADAAKYGSLRRPPTADEHAEARARLTIKKAPSLEAPALPSAEQRAASIAGRSQKTKHLMTSLGQYYSPTAGRGTGPLPSARRSHSRQTSRSPSSASSSGGYSPASLRAQSDSPRHYQLRKHGRSSSEAAQTTNPAMKPTLAQEDELKLRMKRGVSAKHVDPRRHAGDAPPHPDAPGALRISMVQHASALDEADRMRDEEVAAAANHSGWLYKKGGGGGVTASTTLMHRRNWTRR